MEMQRLIEAQIPRLNRYARALTHNAMQADDLVQECLVRALSKQHLWQEGTDLRAWLFTILHNQYVNQVRRSVKQGAAVAISETEPTLTRAADQGRRLELRDLDRALAKLPKDQRVVILMVGLEGMSYDAVAELLKVPVGTVRSRLSRGREVLRRLMNGVDSKPGQWRPAKVSIPRSIIVQRSSEVAAQKIVLPDLETRTFMGAKYVPLKSRRVSSSCGMFNVKTFTLLE